MPPISEPQLLVMRDWLQVLCHAITCGHKDGTCPLSDRCAMGKAILKHIILCDPRTCDDSRCAEYRGLIEHYISCTVGTNDHVSTA